MGGLVKRVNKQNVHILCVASTMQYLTQHHTHEVVGSVLIGLSVVNSYRETPGPIPNPEAKPAHADGTATGRLWESKSPPTPNNKKIIPYDSGSPRKTTTPNNCGRLVFRGLSVVLPPLIFATCTLPNRGYACRVCGFYPWCLFGWVV